MILGQRHLQRHRCVAYPQLPTAPESILNLDYVGLFGFSRNYASELEYGSFSGLQDAV